jgi:hypothetical protein
MTTASTSWQGLAGKQQGEEIHLDDLLAAQEFEQYFHSLAGGQDFHHGGADPAERAVGEFELFGLSVVL